MDLNVKLTKLQEWKPPSKQGLWHLFDDCLPTDGGVGKSGLAIQGALCRMDAQAGKHANVGITYYSEYPVLGDFTWRTFAHEIGHTFGAGHPFGQDLVLTDGGIMAYGTGLYECKLGFHPRDKDDICPVLSAAEKNCAAFSILDLSREQFLSTLPAQPLSFDPDVLECGWNGLTFTQLVIVACSTCCGCCCCTICFCVCMRRMWSRIRSACCGSDEDEDEAWEKPTV